MSTKLLVSRLLELIQLPTEEFNPKIVQWIESFETIPQNEVQSPCVNDLKNEMQTESIESICTTLVQGYIAGFTLHEHDKSMQIFTLVLQHFLQKNASRL